MVREPPLFRQLVLLLVAALPAPVLGQAAVAPPTAVDSPQSLLERLSKMEQRLDWLTQQNETLLRENGLLTAKFNSAAPNSGEPVSPGAIFLGPVNVTESVSPAASFGPVTVTEPLSPGATSGPSTVTDEFGTAASQALDALGQRSPTAGTQRPPVPTRGGGSTSSGIDPQTIGQAQEVGNLFLGKIGLNPSYDFDHGGVHFATKDGDYSFGFSGMTQLDGMLFARPTPGPVTSSGFYNPRSRIYFDGSITRPITWEFSLQNFYDTVQLLDAYVNFNYDPRFQVRIGRYKAPFGYEWYRIHIWNLLTPERSLWSNNFEANRRFGVMAHGVLFDERVEYAAGSFDTQRNSFRPFNSRQDFLAFLNIKPFYDREQGFLLRDLHCGASVDLGNENQSPVPAVLRAEPSPGPAARDSSAAVNSAALPFLALGPNVLEHGGRALWETHLAYYKGGLTFLSALEGGHDAYSNGLAAPRVHVPVNGWFVQAGYILTGETIRDRTLIQPLRPFDLRPGRFGPGAWEVTARYSQLDLGADIFTAALADPKDSTNHAKMVDVGFNWYLNQFVKVYLDWEHCMFGSPVLSTNGGFRTSSDLYWLRAQVYF